MCFLCFFAAEEVPRRIPFSITMECTRCLSTHAEEERDCPNPALERLLEMPDFESAQPNPTPTKVKIKQLLRCPVNWRELAPAGFPVVDEFEFYWKLVATQCLKRGTGNFEDLIAEGPANTPAPPNDFYEHLSDQQRSELKETIKKLKEASGESFEVYFSPGMLDLEDEEDLQDELPEIEEWIERSQKAYRDKMRRFEKMVIADDDEYRKHFRPPNEPVTKTRELSGKGKRVSYFYKSVTRERLRILWWDLLWHCYLHLLTAAQDKLYVDAGAVIGASMGKDTSYILLVVDLSTPRVHAYPILKNAIPRDAYVMHSTVLGQ